MPELYRILSQKNPFHKLAQCQINKEIYHKVLFLSVIILGSLTIYTGVY